VVPDTINLIYFRNIILNQVGSDFGLKVMTLLFLMGGKFWWQEFAEEHLKD
jgi:hypothetical protein